MAIKQEPCFPDSIGAAAGSNVPAGNISSTTIQGAINELDTEKAPSASPTLTGTVNVSGNIKLAINEPAALTGNVTLAAGDKNIQVFDPNGANRDVTLDATHSTGDWYHITNKGTGGYILTVKNSGGTTIGTVANGVTVGFRRESSAWRGYV